MKELADITLSQIETMLRHDLEQDMEREAGCIEAHDVIAAIFREHWAGKKLNRRILDQFKAAWAPAREPGVTCNYVNSFGVFYVQVWGTFGNPTYESRIMIQLAHDSEPTEPLYLGHWAGRINPEGFEFQDATNGRAAKERQRGRLDLLQNGGLAPVACAIHGARQSLAHLAQITAHGAIGRFLHHPAESLIKGDKIQ